MPPRCSISFGWQGFDTASVTGPGLSMARHQISFQNDRKYADSSRKSDRTDGHKFCAIYAKALDFHKISRPKWHKRRFEELRRMRFLSRLVRTSRRSVLVLEGGFFGAVFRRTNWALAATGFATALVYGKRFGISFQRTPVEHLFQRLTGQVSLAPEAHLAENAAYEAAFTGEAAKSAVRLTAARAEQAAQYHHTRGTIPEAVLDDVTELARSVQKFDFRHLSSVRLLGDGTIPAEPASGPLGSPALDTANTIEMTHGVPLTRYMLHLRTAETIARRFPIRDRKGAEAYLNWYLTECCRQLPARWVPVPRSVRDWIRTEAGDTFELLDGDEHVVHTDARDENPFSLGAGLVRHFVATPQDRERYDLADPVHRISFATRTALALSEDAIAGDVLGASAVRYLSAPIGGVPNNVTRFEFLLALTVRLELPGMSEIDQPWQSEALRSWARLDRCRAVAKSRATDRRCAGQRPGTTCGHFGSAGLGNRRRQQPSHEPARVPVA